MFGFSEDDHSPSTSTSSSSTLVKLGRTSSLALSLMTGDAVEGVDVGTVGGIIEDMGVRGKGKGRLGRNMGGTGGMGRGLKMPDISGGKEIGGVGMGGGGAGFLKKLWN